MTEKDLDKLEAEFGAWIIYSKKFDEMTGLQVRLIKEWWVEHLRDYLKLISPKI